MPGLHAIITFLAVWVGGSRWVVLSIMSVIVLWFGLGAGFGHFSMVLSVDCLRSFKVTNCGVFLTWTVPSVLFVTFLCMIVYLLFMSCFLTL